MNDIQVMDTDVIESITRAEIDVQIATAKKYSRNIEGFFRGATALISRSPQIAGECVYALPRGGKDIIGPSARFAEIVQSCWGNSRAGARIVDEGKQMVTAQAIFHDLETNVATTFEVKRRITDSYGKRYNADMIGVTSNAACSIALRNAILKGIPKAFWQDLFELAQEQIKGGDQSLGQRVRAAVTTFNKHDFSEGQMLGLIGLDSVDDVTADHLVALRGMLTALKDGDTTRDELLGTEKKQDEPSKPKRETSPAKPPQEKTSDEKPKADEEKDKPKGRSKKPYAEMTQEEPAEPEQEQKAKFDAGAFDGFDGGLDGFFQFIEEELNKIEDMSDLFDFRAIVFEDHDPETRVNILSFPADGEQVWDMFAIRIEELRK